ncbi:MAG: MBL fold metallo-hydrolase [Nitrospirae bacterium]|nr:MBL fold metallo-hydrolase [Nitrospirota bacterium]
MGNVSNLNLNYDRPVKIAEDTYWIGFYDKVSGLHCNPYLIVDGDEAVVIDGGSRPDFPIVMMKILQAGVLPSSIKALIYQHYDPDLCGSIPNFEDIIGQDNIMLISDRENHMFIRHYYVSNSTFYALEDVNFEYTFSSGRKLQFINTPYAHSQGSFITFDTRSGVLFSSDLFGSYSVEWELFLKLDIGCRSCAILHDCPKGKKTCPIEDIMKFHRVIMTSDRALKYALEKIVNIPFNIIAPQHGSIIHYTEDIINVFQRLAALEGVGVDSYLVGRPFVDMGNVSALIRRLRPE